MYRKYRLLIFFTRDSTFNSQKKLCRPATSLVVYKYVRLRDYQCVGPGRISGTQFEFDQRILQGTLEQGQKNAPDLTSEPNVIKTPNLACGLVFTKSLEKIVLSSSHKCDVTSTFSKNNFIFAMPS